MNNSQKMGLDQSLQQSIAPQMQQSLRVLQAPTLELSQIINEEIAENPVLEDETPTISLEADTRSDEQIDQQIANLSRLDQEWKEYGAQSNNSKDLSNSEDDEKKYQFAMDSILNPKTLQSHLLHQFQMASDDENVLKAGELLIGDLDQKGYLQETVDEISLNHGFPKRFIVEALTILKTLDPPGLGAKDLEDCLLIQLEAKDKKETTEYKIVDSFLDELAKKKYSQIAKSLNLELEEVELASKEISTLNPSPGTLFQSDTNPHVRADVKVEKKDGEWIATLTNDNIPRLKISNEYKELLAKSGNSEEVRAYLREKIRSGKFLIKSIQSRQDTILRITNSILERQQDFFEIGPENLKPMIMSSIAQELEVHETTISRAVNGKYMRTPYGLFELRSFFSWGYTAEDGNALSNVSVKNALSELIKSEDSRKPLSDQKIVEALKEKGIPVARRTVAKYRDALHILPSHLRKKGS